MSPATDPRYPDLETQQIAERMEKEGHKLPFVKDDPTAINPPVKDEDELSDEEKAEAEAKAAADAKAKEEADAKAKADLEAAGKKSDEIKADPKETLIVAQKRKIKDLETTLEAQTGELKQEIEKLKTQITSGSPKALETKAEVDAAAANLEQLVNAIVEKAEGSIEPGVVKSILEAAKQLVASGNQLPPELTEKLAKFEKRELELTAQQEEQQTIASETQKFNDEFKQEIAENADIKKIVTELGMTMDELKDKIYNFIYSEQGVRYAGVPLGEVFTLKQSLFVPTHKKSAEPGRGGSSLGQSAEDKPKTADEIAAMSPKDFEEYSNDLAKKSRSVITRRGKTLN